MCCIIVGLCYAISSVVIQEVKKEVARLEDQLQRTVADLAAIRNAKLKDAEVATKELLKRNKFL